MAHGFRLSPGVGIVPAGTYIYCSKAGNDANDGLTPETAKLTALATIVAAQSYTGAIFGEGVYEESIFVTSTSTKHYFADGKVIFRSTGNNQFGGSGSGLWHFYKGFEFIGYLNITVTNGNLYFYGCTLRSCKFQGYRLYFGHDTYGGCLLVDCSGGYPATNNTAICSYIFCKVINTNIQHAPGSTVIRNSDLDENSTAVVAGAISSASFTNSNIRGPIIERPSVNSGSPTTTYANLAAFQAVQPTAFPNSFSLDPLYNNKAGNDYTVSAFSPNIRAAENGKNIGEVVTGVSHWVDQTVKPTNKAFLPISQGGEAFLSPELQVSADGISIIQPNESGYIITGAIDVSNGKNAEITNIRLPNNLEFNTTFTAPNIRNMNVPDANNGTAGAADRNPNRLSVFMRWTTSTAKPTTDLEWNNQAYLPVGEWGLFNLFEKPLVDMTGKTSGQVDFAFTATNNRFIMAKWVQFKIVLINNYAK